MTTGDGRICQSCGAPSEASDQFCGNCGNRLDQALRTEQGRSNDLAPEKKETGEVVAAIAEIYDVTRFLGTCQRDPDAALLKISMVQERAPAIRSALGVLMLKFIALAQKTINDYESKENVIDEKIQSLCEECLSEYVRVREAASVQADKGMLSDIEPWLDKIKTITEQYAPGRAGALLGYDADNDTRSNPMHAAGKTHGPSKLTSGGNDHSVKTTLRDLAASGVPVGVHESVEGHGIYLTDFGRVRFSVPFPVRYVSLSYGRRWWRTSRGRITSTHGFCVGADFYNVPREALGRPSFEEVRRFDGWFLKDCRRLPSGQPVDPDNFDRWFFTSDSEARKRLEAEFERAEKEKTGRNCFIATAVFDDPDARQVVILRAFRDNLLLRYAPGRLAVRIYYRLSPPVATRIGSSPAMKALVRHILDLLVRMLPNPDCNGRAAEQKAKLIRHVDLRKRE